ncbi:MAG: hypothetical protein FD129_2415, partial [bacterium]
NRSLRFRPALILALTPLLFAATLPLSSLARPRPEGPAIPEYSPDDTPPSFLISGLASGSVYDTSWYGGTVWAADSNRWEAIPDGIWTFDSGVGSAIQNEMPEVMKPNGYHRLMEGWMGLGSDPHDSGTFRRSTSCAISGDFSMWLGKTPLEIEADGQCWATGQGYGNSWNACLERSFAYPGSGDVTFGFEYAVDAEPDFDALTVVVRPSNAASDIVLAYYEGLVGGQATFILQQANGTLPTGPGTVTIRFTGTSDGAYSDEDGLYPTICGLAALDNITLTGAIAHVAGFESSDDGWTFVHPPTPLDDFSDLRDSGELMTPSVGGFLCDCGLRDSVLVFIDPSHDRAEDSYPLVISPWIDLRAGGDLNHPGRVIPGRIGVSPLDYLTTIFYYGNASCGSRIFDLSGRIPSGAEQVRIILGPISPFTGMIDPPPYIDNVRFGVYGPANAPVLSVVPGGQLQDNFAADGTLNPASAARLDVGRLISGSGPAAVGDSLTASASGVNVEVRLVFRVRPGPFTNQSALAAVASRWTPEPGIGSSWYSARMDTAEGGSGFGANWMAMFHEDDPGFVAP